MEPLRFADRNILSRGSLLFLREDDQLPYCFCCCGTGVFDFFEGEFLRLSIAAAAILSFDDKDVVVVVIECAIRGEIILFSWTVFAVHVLLN